MIFFGEKALRRAVKNYLEHCHAERNHQALGNEIIEAGDEVSAIAGRIVCRERLDGVLHYYHRDAAYRLVKHVQSEPAMAVRADAEIGGESGLGQMASVNRCSGHSSAK